MPLDIESDDFFLTSSFYQHVMYAVEDLWKDAENHKGRADNERRSADLLLQKKT